MADHLGADDGDRDRDAAASPTQGRQALTGDTIWAWATPPGRSAVAVLRISGPAALQALAKLGVARPPAPRRAVLARLRDGPDGPPIDQALLLRFAAPASFTGEDLVELQHHGGIGVRRMLAATLGRMPGLRPAEPGEFTRRAYLAGKLDLAAVEGLGDLIEATTARGVRAALSRLEGSVGRQIGQWHEQLMELRAAVEAELDFAADQADVASGTLGRIGPGMMRLRVELADALAQAPAAERLRHGFVVTVVGAPNVGKSSLVNLLVGREVAIVTDRPGTTRDPVEVALDLDGLPVTLIDTAGLRDSDDPIEQEGMRRAREKAASADLVLELIDANEPVLPALPAVPLATGQTRLVVANKADLTSAPADHLAISCRTGAGIDRLLAELVAALAAPDQAEAGAVPVGARAEAALCDALAALDDALAAAHLSEPVLVAEALRHASQALARVTGAGADAEDVLDRIFARFCIGK
ncbi:tRNA uridine-5-carboxymethylaminomethyl(34) synthesis GTPase MnmE [Geminicoccus flavidas]|uniref:tRNA uridine-5-carboxymethylaminomethyl(34) synthesis GTPase MnmE n=1 Tax=Geminicoccus flavidas TaxID=2506407 RepID=UPI001F41D34B|nr:tRNA uridine-5-carboxymethylaminomethyl(34) synthesis GTPase MnmE [Geminicoccus flavidas]